MANYRVFQSIYVDREAGADCSGCYAPMEYQELGYHAGRTLLCESCASEVANLYNYAHSGEYLTWPNPAPLGSSRTKKKKISATLRTKVFERDKYRCVHCGTHKNLCVDHIHPESLGGPTEFDNLQTLCRSCNSKKGTRAA